MLVKSFLLWLPRVLSVLFAGFISLFALDVFGAGYGLWETIWALFVHLIPTWLILAAPAISWRWEWLGGVLFPLLGVLYIVTFRGFQWSVYLGMAGPLFVIGDLFLSSWLYRKSLRRGV